MLCVYLCMCLPVSVCVCVNTVVFVSDRVVGWMMSGQKTGG